MTTAAGLQRLKSVVGAADCEDWFESVWKRKEMVKENGMIFISKF
jgi:hypothetical protein